MLLLNNNNSKLPFTVFWFFTKCFSAFFFFSFVSPNSLTKYPINPPAKPLGGLLQCSSPVNTVLKRKLRFWGDLSISLLEGKFYPQMFLRKQSRRKEIKRAGN